MKPLTHRIVRKLRRTVAKNEVDMAEQSTSLGRRQRGGADQERDREVYRYLLTLTDLGMTDDSPLPNETSIAKQWGGEANRIFIRRMLRSVMFDEIYREKEEKQPPVPGLTLSKLVGILSALQNYQKENQFLYARNKASHIITRAEKLKALQIFFRLSPEEREQLDLAVHPAEALLSQIVEKATDTTGLYQRKDISRLYRFFLQQLGESSITSFAEEKGAGRALDLQAFIENTVESYTEQYFQGLESFEKAQRDRSFVKKVEREINRIELQSGIEQVDSYSLKKGLRKVKKQTSSQRLRSYLTPDFVRKLSHSVIDNELLTDVLPIHLKHFEIERVKPLPLHIKLPHDQNGLLNPLFLPKQQEAHSGAGLERQVAYRVRVHFYIKLPDDYTVRFKDDTIAKETAGQRRLEFSEEVVGIGCITSHITAVINRVLFWGVPLLETYFPIADGMNCHDEVVGSTPNGPVFSHCVARLYKRSDVQTAVELNKPCSEVATSAEVASADFCGFDLIETTAKAALYARLRLIKQTLANEPSMSTQSYIKDLCNRVEEITALKSAQQYLRYYPFSLRAMEGKLEETIFQDGRYRQRKKGLIFEHNKDTRTWSDVALEAHLSVAEANLREGLVHVGRKYLDAMRSYFEGDKRDAVSELLMTRYHLCLFRYHYMSDLDEADCAFPDRYSAVREAERELNNAEKTLSHRLRYYDAIDELTQNNLHPQFYFLSRICAHRAKLHIFFPTYMPGGIDLWEQLLEPVKILEKARIYAARDGDPALYAQWSAYQSWCYVMLAYLGKEEVSQQADLSPKICLDWAKRLIKHAEICYSEMGKVCYQQIKDAGGQVTKYACRHEGSANAQFESLGAEASEEDIMQETKGLNHFDYYVPYGSTYVQVIPLIRELFDFNGEKSSQQLKQYGADAVELDLSLLKHPGKDESSSIYLFGMQAGILLFAKGVFCLCDDYDSDEKLIAAIDAQAMRMFQYCCAIASDGTKRIEETDSRWPDWADSGDTILSRDIPKIDDNDDHVRDRLLQYLYPSRLTQFADLGKIFIIACRLIFLVTGEDVKEFYENSPEGRDPGVLFGEEIRKIHALVKELRKNDQFPFSARHAHKQERYNGHLAQHHIYLERYVNKFIENFQGKMFKQTNPLYVRDKLVKDIFSIIRGDANTVPRL